MKKISVALATYNEEQNIGECLKSVQGLAWEIVVVDGESADKTAEIAQSLGAKVVSLPNNPMFHLMKQSAFDLCQGDWILYLDADERIGHELALEIKKVVEMDALELEAYQQKMSGIKQFVKHQKLLEKRDGVIGVQEGDYVAFFMPRLNYFLGKYLKYGGVWPDGVIRLFKKGRAYLPCKDVHEQMAVEGRVGWLKNNLFHFADPTFSRYLQRNSRYINLIVKELQTKKNSFLSPINYLILKPIWWFLITQIRHKGILDGWQGVVFSLFSALRFPRAYWRYLTQ